jgi:hypothetical protein
MGAIMFNHNFYFLGNIMVMEAHPTDKPLLAAFSSTSALSSVRQKMRQLKCE